MNIFLKKINGGNMKQSKNILKDKVKLDPSDEEIMDAILNGYIVCGFHTKDGKDLTLFCKP